MALEAARLMVDRVETEYLHAKERAILSLGLAYNTPYPTNKQVPDWSQRGEVFMSSITGKPMKRADLEKVRKLLKE